MVKEVRDTISFSEMSTLLRCTQRWQYAYGEDLESAKPPLYLNKGKLLHVVLAYWLKEYSIEESWDLAREDLSKEGLTLPDDILQLRSLIEAFTQKYPLMDDDTEVVDVEREFTVDLGLPNGVKLHGFIDAVVRQGDQLFVVEHKTASRAWSNTQFDFHYQMPLYILAAQELYGDVGQAQGLYNFFYPKRFEQTFTSYTSQQLDMVWHQLASAVRIRQALTAETTTRQAHWGCNDCWYREICLAELGGDQWNANYLRETKFLVRDREGKVGLTSIT